jgi:tRNA nucleotidyltransferase/poly(A) polymerase
LVVVYESETNKTSFEIASIKETFQKDAELRDLTINSLFFDINRKKILDYNETAFDDIKNKIIRTPKTLDDQHAFVVTPLAILRTIRFSSRYNFNIDENTQKDIVRYRDNLLSITAHNRIIEEFKKALKQSSQNYKLYLETLINFDLLKYIFKQNELLLEKNEINKIKINDPILISSFILKDIPNVNPEYLLDLKGYNKNEIQIIIFLCNLYKIIITRPNFEMAFKLKSAYKKIDKNLVSNFLESLGISSNTYEKLLNYLNSSLTTGRDFMDPNTKQIMLKGAELDAALIDAEKKKYNVILNINENKKYKNSYKSKKGIKCLI